MPQDYLQDKIFRFVVTDPKGATDLIKIYESTLSNYETHINIQEQRIIELEARLNQNSSNSSFPPSRDIYPPNKNKADDKNKTNNKDNKSNKNRNTSLRNKSGKKVGGQQGHKGTTLELNNNPHETSNIEVNTCPCGNDLSDVGSEKYIRRQVFDTPPVDPRITEFRAEVKYCPKCGRRIVGPFPENVNQTVQYGDNLKANALYIKNQIFTSYEKEKTYFMDQYCISISPATIIAFEKNAHITLNKFEYDLRDELIKSSVLNADETGLRVIGERWWLHSIGNEHLTLYAVHPKRGSVATDEMGVLPQYDGVLVHDFWVGYSKYNCTHSYCNAHIIRELNGVWEGYKQNWAKDMIDLYKQIHHYLFIEDKKDPLELEKFRIKYMKIIESGFEENPPPAEKKAGQRGRVKNSKPFNLLVRLRDYEEDILRFMYNSLVPFTNNLAERDVRMMKVQQKISGTFRSIAGAERFCRIRSYISTVRKCGKSVFGALKRLVQGNPYTVQELIG